MKTFSAASMDRVRLADGCSRDPGCSVAKDSRCFHHHSLRKHCISQTLNTLWKIFRFYTFFMRLSNVLTKYSHAGIYLFALRAFRKLILLFRSPAISVSTNLPGTSNMEMPITCRTITCRTASSSVMWHGGDRSPSSFPLLRRSEAAQGRPHLVAWPCLRAGCTALPMMCVSAPMTCAPAPTISGSAPVTMERSLSA